MLFLILLAIVVLPPLLMSKTAFEKLVRMSVRTWYCVGALVLLIKLL
jgi:hypothetical protein